LGDGHYFINDSGLVIDKPLRIVGDENDPAHVVLEMSGEMVWKSCGGWMEGITIRRPRISTGVTPNSEILRLEGRVDMFHCVFDNRGSSGNCVSVRSGGVGRWERASINGASRDKHGLLIEKDAKLELLDVSMAERVLSLFMICGLIVLIHFLLFSAASQIMMGSVYPATGSPQ